MFESEHKLGKYGGTYAHKLIKEGKEKEERFEILSEIAKYQLDILNNAEKRKDEK